MCKEHSDCFTDEQYGGNLYRITTAKRSCRHFARRPIRCALSFNADVCQMWAGTPKAHDSSVRDRWVHNPKPASSIGNLRRLVGVVFKSPLEAFRTRGKTGDKAFTSRRS